MLWASPVKHQQARKSQQSSFYCVCSKCTLSKLMVLYLPSWRFGLNHFHKLADCAESGRRRGWLQVPAICRWQWLHNGPLPLSGHCPACWRSLFDPVSAPSIRQASARAVPASSWAGSWGTGTMPKQDLRTTCSYSLIKSQCRVSQKKLSLPHIIKLIVSWSYFPFP